MKLARFLSLLVLFFAFPLFASVPVALREGLQKKQIYQVSFKQIKSIPFLKKPFTSQGVIYFHHKKGIYHTPHWKPD